MEAEIKRLEKMEGLTSNISRDAGKLAEEVRKSRDKLKQLVGKGKAVLMALEVEVTDVEAERASPIQLEAGGL